MKKILITAKHSFVGSAFAEWNNSVSQDNIDYISCRTDNWKDKSFQNYDVILHVAGIAHIDAKANMEELYFKVNRDLTIALAEKAKSEGIKQFIFMSSAIVFGESNSKCKSLAITKDTIPKPNGFYGDSKLQAEEGLIALQDVNFKVAIIRSPMIYGYESKGNFKRLEKIAKMSPVFPNIINQRSMIYIDNLCEFIRLIIENEDFGTFYPQNKEYVCTSDMVKMIASFHGKKIILTKVFNPILYLMQKNVNIVNKIFGSFVYEKDMSEYKDDYCLRSLAESIELIELSNLK